jgi:two-component sensor histidine kinase
VQVPGRRDQAPAATMRDDTRHAVREMSQSVGSLLVREPRPADGAPGLQGIASAVAMLSGTSPEHSPAAASARAYRWIVAIILLYAAAAVAVMPVAGARGPDLPSITPFFVAGVLATELSTSFLLFVLTRETRTWSLLMLGCAYLYGSLMSIFHLLTFPNAVLPDYIVIGTDQSARWIYNFWYAGGALLALVAIVLEIPGWRIVATRVGRAIALAVAGVIAAVVATVTLSIAGVDHLPALIRGSSWTRFDVFLISFELSVLLVGIALVLLVLRRRSVIFLLLSLVLTAMAFSQILSLEGPGRFTVGWSLGRLSWFLSACVLFLFFMKQFSEQQTWLARSRELLELRVNQRTAELTETIKQRDVLLRELHHRIKNKMQIVDALLAMQARQTGEPEARQTLHDLRSRISVLALAHQHFMASDFQTFDLEQFLRELTGTILANGTKSDAVLRLDASPLMVTIDQAAPLGLLVTELMIDCLEHCVAPAGARIALTIRRNEAHAGVLTLADNRPADDARLHKAASDKAQHRSRIVAGLVRQLDATMIVDRSHGSVEITFPAPEEESK